MTQFVQFTDTEALKRVQARRGKTPPNPAYVQAVQTATKDKPLSVTVADDKAARSETHKLRKATDSLTPPRRLDTRKLPQDNGTIVLVFWTVEKKDVPKDDKPAEPAVTTDSEGVSVEPTPEPQEVPMPAAPTTRKRR